MNYIPEDIINQIRESTDILEVAQDYFKDLKKKGGSYWTSSPWANDSNHSFSINPKLGIFNCFSTGKKGNAAKLVMEMESCSWLEAMHVLAKRYGIDTSRELSEAERGQQQRKQSLLSLMLYAVHFYCEKLNHAQHIKDSILEERGFDEDIIKTFMLGYAPEGWDVFTRTALRQGYSEVDLIESGLSIKTKKETIIDRFRNRLMFPIMDKWGHPVSFGGRDLSGEKEAPKYLNGPETLIYHKSNALYNIDRAKDSIIKEDSVYIVEGYTDVIGMYKAGIKNAVASCGTAFTEAQGKLLKGFSQNIISILDGDTAGQKATSKMIPVIVTLGLELTAVSLPDDLDPDKFVRERGSVDFQSFLNANENQIHWIDFQIKYLQATHDATSASGKARIAEEMVDLLKKVGNSLLREEYTREISKRLNLNFQTLKEMVKDKPLTLKRQLNWEETKSLYRKLNLPPSPYFERAEDGGVRIGYHTPKGHTMRKGTGDDAQEVYNVSTQFESPYGAYVPYAWNSTGFDPFEVDNTLFITHDEITADILTHLGMAAVGIARPDGFRLSSGSKKPCKNLQAMVKEGYQRIIYIVPGEGFMLPPVKGKKGYSEADAGQLAGTYAETLIILQKAFSKQRIWTLCPNHRSEDFDTRSPRWIEDLLLKAKDINLKEVFYSAIWDVESKVVGAQEITNSPGDQIKSLFKLNDAQKFFEFHGIQKLGQTFKLGKQLYEVDIHSGQVIAKDTGAPEPSVRPMWKVYCAKGRDGGWKPITNFTMKCEIKIMGRGAFGIFRIDNPGTGQTRTVLITNEEFLDAKAFSLRVSEIPNLNAYSQAASSHLSELHRLVCEGENEASNLDRAMGFHMPDDEYDLIADESEGMWVFGNGILTEDGVWHEIDDQGFVKLGEKKYFIPACSPIKRDAKKHKKSFEWQRKFQFKTSEMSFAKWCETMRFVYQDNAHKGIAFSIMAMYYDLILEKQGEVPMMHVMGEPQSGKSKFVDSMAALWTPHLKVLDLQARRITEAAYAAHFEQYDNVLNIVNEVNASSVSEDRIYPLKSLYEGRLGEKMAGAHTKEMYSGLATSASVLIGQESITHLRAIAERCISSVIEKRKYSAIERRAFNELKSEIEPNGLGQVFAQLSLHRELIDRKFTERFQKTQNDIALRMEASTSSERFIRNWACMLTPMFILMSEGIIDYPKSIDWLLTFAAKEIQKQEKSMVSQGLLGIFFHDFIEPFYMDKQYGLTHNHVFHDKDSLQWTDKKTRKSIGTPKGIINIQTTHAHARFSQFLSHRRLKLENASVGDLRRQLKSHPAFIGTSDSEWLGYKINEKGNIITHYNGNSDPAVEKKRSSAYVFDASKLKLSITTDFRFGDVRDDDLNGHELEKAF